MKRTLSLWLGLLAFALMPALAQDSAPTAPAKPMGKIHGHVTNPTGAPQGDGSVSLSNDNGKSSKFTFPVSAGGDYTGEALPGTYTVVYRQKDTPPDKMVDSFDNIKIIVGVDLLQDFDMSRKEFVDKMPADQQKMLAELKKKNAEALAANAVIKNLNADIRTSVEDFKAAETAHAAAVAALGASASKADIDAKEADIKNAKYSEVETIMLKDTAAKPDASVLWAQLGQSQLGLKKFDEALVSYQKALDVEATSKKPSLSVQGAANSGMGEIYARTGKVPEAQAAYDAAAKANPPQAGFYLKNEAVIFYQVQNPSAQAAAADKAIQADPTAALAYYLKGAGLVANATEDQATHKLVAPAGCLEAYQKYLELAPTGTYADEVKAILAGFNQKVDTTYKAPKQGKSR